MGCGGSKDDKTQNPKVIPSPVNNLQTSESPSKSKDYPRIHKSDKNASEDIKKPSAQASSSRTASSTPLQPKTPPSLSQPSIPLQSITPTNPLEPVFLPKPIDVLSESKISQTSSKNFRDSWILTPGVLLVSDTISTNSSYSNIIYKKTITTGVSIFEFEVIGSHLDYLLIGAFRSDLNPGSTRLDSKSGLEIFSYEGRGFTHTEFGEFTYNQRAWRFSSNDHIKLEIDMSLSEIRYYKNDKRVHTHDSIPASIRLFLGLSSNQTIKLIQEPT
jgi:hypothetical protein